MENLSSYVFDQVLMFRYLMELFNVLFGCVFLSSFLFFRFFDDDAADVASGGGGSGWFSICIDIIAIVASASDADSVYYLFY